MNALAGSPKPVVYVVVDDDSLRTALGRLLSVAGYQTRDYPSVGHFMLEVGDAAPGCVVLDVRMPGPSGFELQQALHERGITLPIIFLTGHGDIEMGVRAMKAGAVDFLTKPVEGPVLLDAVRNALSREADAREAHEQSRSVRARYDTLSPRERQVLGLVVAGKLNKQIAAEIGTSERTVKAHRAQMMEKMGVKTLADLIHAADTLTSA